MGSDDFCVKVRKIEACDSVSGAPSGSARACSSAYDVIEAVDAIEALSSHKSAPAKFLKCENQASHYDMGDISKNFVDENGNSACRLIPEEFQSPWKARKVSKINFTSSKRARVRQNNGFLGTTPIDDFKDLFNKSLKRSISLVEKNDLVRQRSVICDKRVERKVSKLVPKNKQDVTIMTSSSTSLAITSGGNNVLGLYGLKSNAHDITQLVGDLSLKEMLESTFECHISSNKKTKDVVNSNDSIMHSLRKACSLLQPRKPTKPQNLAESYSFTENKMPTDILGPISMDEGGGDGDSGDPTSTKLSSASKNHNNRKTPERQTSSLDLCFYQPKELWDKLELMNPTDLDSLLLDGSKPSTPSRSLSDLRPGKQVTTQRGCLPPFAWSHAFNGISRSNSDAAKFPASRMSCQAKWVRIANTYGLSVNNSDCYSDLNSIRYNKDLVPSVEGACAMPLSKMTSPESSVAPKQEGITSSFAACPPSSNDHCTDMDRHSPSLLAAARTLYGIASSSPRGNPAHLLKWSREFARKSPVNPEKPKCSKRPEEDFVITASVSKDHARNHEHTPSKKPRISNIQLSYRKTSTSWSTPRSSRSSQSLSIRESVTSISKQPPCVVSSASRVLDRAIDSHKRPNRSIPLFWGRRGDGLR